MDYLGLTRNFPSQLSIQDAISMISIDEDKTQGHTDLPSVFLYHLMKNDFQWRDRVQKQMPNADEYGKEKQRISTSIYLENTEAENDSNFFLSEEEFNLESFSTSVVHPNDILLNTILCCNLELKQVIFQKLLMCKQSVPLIYRIPGWKRPSYSLFPLRSMSMECRTKQGPTVLCAATMKSKIVGFIRIGNSRQSKSKFLNDVLNEQKHATFCHRDVIDENTRPLNTKGLVEAAWFLPSGKPSDPFEEVVTFLNLRGDASCFPNEISIVGKIASAIVTLVDTSCLANEETAAAVKKICDNSSHVIVLVTNNLGRVSLEKVKSNLRQCIPNVPEKIKVIHNFNWKTNNLKPEVTVRKEVVTAIKKIIARQEGSSLRECGNRLWQDKQVILDEETNDSAEGRSAAKQVFSGLCSKDEARRFLRSDSDNAPTVVSKEEHLPLQGELWKKWSELNKKQHKNKGGASIIDLGNIQQEMNDIQQKQASKCCPLTQSMSDFIKCLYKANDTYEGYPLFLLWLKLFLNENSRKVLPGLFTEFRQSWLKVSEAKDRNADENEIKSLQKVAQQAEIKLATASFGMEHFMRELGQLYESAVLSKQPLSGNISKQKLPKVMADLILKGQAFEIMDGDAANIAITWVKAVLGHLKEAIGHKKLFVISVLGIQSSGKSTLLNALFGLQFTVSTGRCTRGVFGQLVPVDKRRNLPYEYILVIDTEGLRAPELGQTYLDHDNELATFVVGIGDVTLINIKGENTAEMKDVLQITVQAFLRMKLANDKMELKRRCIFIHQNVGAVNAEEQMMQGLKKLQENLDEMTKHAAEEENMRHIQSFSQVIDFQGEKHVLYFPDLWYGDPPMAPSNPGYSMKVVEVLQRLENMASNGSALTTIDGLAHRIEDLWNGILAENFVFSFRNTLEIKTYNSMESKYQTLSGEYGHCILEWFEKEASIEIELCKSKDKLQKCYEDLKNKIQVEFIQRKANIEKQLTDYFDNNEMNYILIQWKNSRVIKFQHMAQAVERNTLKYIEQKIEEQRIVILSKTTNMKLEEDINAKAKELAKSYQGQQVEERALEHTFDNFWIKWTKECIGTRPSDFDPGSVTNMIVETLLQRLEKHQALVYKELSDGNNGIMLKHLHVSRLENSWTAKDINGEHISIKAASGFKEKAKEVAKGMVGLFVGKSQASIDKLTNLALDYTNNVFRKIDVEFENLLKKDVPMRNEYARYIINKTVEVFEHENNLPDNKLTFQTPYEVKLVVHVCSYAHTKFELMAERYEKEHGIKGKLDAYKNTAKHLFLNTVQRKSDEFVAADFFCDRVKERVIDTIKAAIPRQIIEDIRRHFNYTKYHVMLEVMEHLVKKRHFPAFILYAKDSQSFVHRWMDKFIKKKIFETDEGSCSRYEKFASSRLVKIMECIKGAIIDATNQTTSEAGNWAQSFESSVKSELAVPSELLDPVTRKITDVMDFKNVLSEKIDILENEILEEFRVCDPDSIVWKGTSPNETVMKEIWGCPEYCPLCREPCKHNEGHLTDGISHSCIQHRPSGVTGTFWTRSGVLNIETCNFSVHSDARFSCKACKLQCRQSGKCNTNDDEIAYHPYKEYKTYLPDWDIAPNPTMDVTKYWMWFVGTYLDELVSQYDVKTPDIPLSWKTISDKDAIESLRVARE